ncbi:hypothetical protein G7Y79_00041g077860 [Physcia stellaris]|nr:hypothetical protein G7Y79_00041g077860 [Physcia stellaris]
MAYLNSFHSGIFEAFFHGTAIVATIINLFLLPFMVYHFIYSKTYILNRITTLKSKLHDLQSSQSYQHDNKLDTAINNSRIEETEAHIQFLESVMQLSVFDRIGVSTLYGLSRLFGCKPYSEEIGLILKLRVKEKKLGLGLYCEAGIEEGVKWTDSGREGWLVMIERYEVYA